MSAKFTPPPADVSPLERRAAEWALRLQRGLTAPEEQEFESWLARDPRHAELFAEMNETSQRLDQLHDPTRSVEATLAAAQMVIRPPARSFRPAWIATAVGAAAAIAVAWIVGWRSAPNVPTDDFTQTAATAVDGVRTLALPDGSTLRINSASAVDIRYTATERRIRLAQGEAFFTVARNPGRPFWVDVDTVSIRAVGTAFNVRYRPAAVEVIVTEGKVRLDQAGQSLLGGPADAAGSTTAATDPRLLVAGEKAVIPRWAEPTAPALTQTLPAPVPPPRVLAWQAQRLEFTDTPLAEVVAEFNRYNAHKLVIANPTLARQTFGGAFAPTGYASLVEILEESFGVVAERDGHETILRKAH